MTSVALAISLALAGAAPRVSACPLSGPSAGLWPVQRCGNSATMPKRKCCCNPSGKCTCGRICNCETGTDEPVSPPVSGTSSALLEWLMAHAAASVFAANRSDSGRESWGMATVPSSLEGVATLQTQHVRIQT
jgi:hypothetical protein